MANLTVVSALIEAIESSEKKEMYLKYIYEATERCFGLCKAGENLRALNECNFLIENLKKEFGL